MKQNIYYGVDAREELIAGINKAVKAIVVTLGPKGNNVIIKREYGPAMVTKDGVSVAKQIKGDSEVEDLGVSMVRSVATQTDTKAGDGTTTASALVKAMIDEGIKFLSANINSNRLREGIDIAVEYIGNYLNDHAIKIDGDKKKISQVAHISANNDEELGSLVAEAFEKISKEGIISIQHSKTSESYVDLVEGMRFDQGFVDSYFTNNETKTEAIYKNPMILITDRVITEFKDIKPYVVRANEKKRPLVIIAEDIKDGALNTLVLNKNQGKVEAVAIRAPFTNEIKRDFLQDIAITTGGIFFEEKKGTPLDPGTADIESMLGSCERIEVTKNHTTIIEGHGEKEVVQRRIDQIQAFLDENNNDYEMDVLRSRLAKIASSVAIIYVGAGSEEEREEKSYRVTDAYRATKAAIEEGYVPGGGVTYLQAQSALQSIEDDYEFDVRMGIQLVRKALSKPLEQMLKNADLPEQVVIEKLRTSKKKNFGLNVNTDTYGDMVKMGIIDPKKVAYEALISASSIAKMVLTAECVVVNNQEEKRKALF